MNRRKGISVPQSLSSIPRHSVPSVPEAEAIVGTSPNWNNRGVHVSRDSMASRTERREKVTRGTGNVFAHLGFPDSAEREAKLRLAYALNQVLDGRKLSQADAAKVL